MKYRVEKAFGCFTLEGFGIFNAWGSIIFNGLGTVSNLLALLLSGGSKTSITQSHTKLRSNLKIFVLGSVPLLLSIAVHGGAIYISKLFIDGVKQVDSVLKHNLQKISFETFQRDHKKMKSYVYVNLAFAAFVSSMMVLLFVIILFDLHYLKIEGAERANLVLIALVVVSLLVGMELYFYVCLNSLFLRIKEENLNTLPSGCASNNNAVLMNQQKPAMTNLPGGFDQPPAYPIEQSSQFAVSMQK